MNKKEIEFEQHLAKQINSTLAKGTKAAFYLAALSTVLMVMLMLLGFMHHMTFVVIWIGWCAVISYISYYLTKNDLTSSYRNKVIMVLTHTTLPTSLFIIGHFTTKFGAATYLNGPASHLYFFIIALSGMFFDKKLSIFSGVASGVQYFFCFWLAYPLLVSIDYGDPIFTQEISHPMIHFFKSLIMVFSGTATGIFASKALEIYRNFIQEEGEKKHIDNIFGQFVSDQVKDRVLKSINEDKGERMKVAILFSDIRGFSSFCEQNEPEIVISQLNEYFDAMVKSIREAGGVVDKFIGDSVMANFGGLLNLANPSEAAVNAALSMQKSLENLNKRWEEKGLTRLENGVGLHFGSVLQGTIGSNERKEFTLIGDAVNTASRLEGLCKELGNPIIISESIFQLVSPQIQGKFQNFGEKLVKGKKKAVTVYGLREV
ncbi:MAG: adenylate/guanylate cyclase domain-containing protein [SAR324 cluster bacterium]|nr:adenylate/guanylate cyclase domain-containing protein [SAR324 cluster bacterium]